MQGAQRINRIVMDLKSFSRMDQPDSKSKVEIKTVIEAAVSLCSSLIKNSTDFFTLEIEENLPAVMGNSQRLEQVVINLLQNACQSLAGRDRAIAVRAFTEKERRMVALEVEDQGEGIESSLLGKITDPFFTIKRSVGGTGLGLSVSQGIINEHQGRIQVRSEKGEGTLVIAYLPAVSAEG